METGGTGESAECASWRLLRLLSRRQVDRSVDPFDAWGEPMPEGQFRALCVRLGVANVPGPRDAEMEHLVMLAQNDLEILARPCEERWEMGQQSRDAAKRCEPRDPAKVPPALLACATVVRWELIGLDWRGETRGVRCVRYLIGVIMEILATRQAPWTTEQLSELVTLLAHPNQGVPGATTSQVRNVVIAVLRQPGLLDMLEPAASKLIPEAKMAKLKKGLKR